MRPLENTVDTVDTAALDLVAQRYRDARAAFDAALADLRIEAAQALRDGVPPEQVSARTGWGLDDLATLVREEGPAEPAGPTGGR
ncbi:hypothetical protein LO771_00135 [Streptacidiphilus sp. ASG 303]|uniref:hypothetical protein n=1 Tax=Streptacidiphilus sp. ASG 303 TaxID=2896847 RepID=UPI001E32E29E|nr:hypothetical protein [Streptacidiphilus sp. ASG 303]MCD0480861.1 hypothetical protein [Streptacidiphilus sp. ASG 303]